MENGALNFAFVGKEMFSRLIEAEPVYRSPFKLVSSVPLPEEVRNPSCLSCDKELFVPWNTEFQLWHDYWFGTAVRPQVWLNIMPPLSSLLLEEGPGRWCLPISPAISGRVTSSMYTTCRKPPILSPCSRSTTRNGYITTAK